MVKKQNENRPTKEDLELEGQKILEEAEKLKDQPIKDDEEKEEELQEEIKEETPEEEIEEIEEEESEEEEQADPSEEAKTKLKEKLSASARENQKIYAKNRVINKAITEAEEIPEPTEEELVKEFKDWELMSDVERLMAKETVISRNWRKVIADAKNQATKIEKWVDSIDEFIDDPKTLSDNPSLEGKEEEFRSFASVEENNNVPFKILISAFLHEQSTKQKPNKGKMFERGSGGKNEKEKPNDGSISIEEARLLRETNYNEWKKYLNAGKIRSEF